jgi:hypothetical protein
LLVAEARSYNTIRGTSLVEAYPGGTLMAEEITVLVDSDVAKLYRSASDDERRKLDLLVNLRLRDAAESGRSLREVVNDISRNAQQRGLTPAILQSILDEE